MTLVEHRDESVATANALPSSLRPTKEADLTVAELATPYFDGGTIRSTTVQGSPTVHGALPTLLEYRVVVLTSIKLRGSPLAAKLPKEDAPWCSVVVTNGTWPVIVKTASRHIAMQNHPASIMIDG